MLLKLYLKICHVYLHVLVANPVTTTSDDSASLPVCQLLLNHRIQQLVTIYTIAHTDTHACMHACTHMRTHAHTRAHTRTHTYVRHTHTHTHTQIGCYPRNAFIFFLRTQLTNVFQDPLLLQRMLRGTELENSHQLLNS